MRRMGLSIHDLASRMDAAAAALETCLGDILSDRVRDTEGARVPRLMAAMRHAVLGGGKRLRPFLVLESARLFGAADEGALRAGAALELIHGYSLVHDDLPAMDDDDVRRGRPTVHKAFDEATAVLAGDGLLTLAFEIAADEETHPDPRVTVALVRILARAAGLGGMVGGQMLDLAAEGRFSDGPIELRESEIAQLQAMKTGALFVAAVEIGAALGQANAEEHTVLTRYGRLLGAAFQIADDLIDIEGDMAVAGKATGKDAERGKATLPGIWGVARAREHLAMLVHQAEEALAPFGAGGDTLRQVARFVAERTR